MIRFLFLLFIFSLIIVNPTNADFNDKKVVKSNQFKATTLDFSQLKTTNDSPVETLFNISGISPGGYQVATLRLKNLGQLNPLYLINFSKTAGSDNFCRQLEINILKDNQSIYNGPLIDLNLKLDLNSQTNYSDFLVFIKLKDNYVSSENDYCDFNLIITGSSHSDSPQPSGFRYQKKILNHISLQ